jgi:hypothetical protein
MAACFASIYPLKVPEKPVQQAQAAIFFIAIHDMKLSNTFDAKFNFIFNFYSTF